MDSRIYAAICSQRAVLFSSDCWRSFLFIILGAASLWLFAVGKIKPQLLAAVLAVLVLFDMWPVDKRYFNDSFFVSPKKKTESFKMYPYEQAILQDKDPNFRVLNLTTNTYNDARTSHYLKSLGGYNAAKLRRYQDLIDEHLSKYHMPVIDMLNAKYFILPSDDGQPEVQYNPGAMGNAWWVGELKAVDNATQESDALMQVDLSKVAVLDKSFGKYVEDFNPGIAGDAVVTLESCTPKDLEYRTFSSKPGTVVFSEIYYPYGWKASIDGQSVEHYRVDYLLRAVNVPAGEHRIHFTFDPDSIRKGETVAAVCLIIMYLLTLALIVKGCLERFRRV